MFASIRRYAGLAPGTRDAMTTRAPDIAAVLRSVPGACESRLIATHDGLVVFTVGADEACLVESGRRFRAWVDARAAHLGPVGEAEVWLGEVVHADDRRPEVTGGES
jgi:hypothetical protein